MTTRRRKREEEDTKNSGGHYTRELAQHKNSVPTRVMLYARDRSPQVSRQTRVEDMWLFLYAPCSVVEPHEEPPLPFPSRLLEFTSGRKKIPEKSPLLVEKNSLRACKLSSSRCDIAIGPEALRGDHRERNASVPKERKPVMSCIL